MPCPSFWSAARLIGRIVEIVGLLKSLQFIEFVGSSKQILSMECMSGQISSSCERYSIAVVSVSLPRKKAPLIAIVLTATGQV